jgi:peptidoglycan/LPS O-acetylase OafA/YrhL
MSTLSIGSPETIIAPSPAKSTGHPRLRLEALDGIRGLAALYVVYYHIGVVLKPLFAGLSAPWHSLFRSTEHGHEGVVTFIVLSGFVLMLPVARSANLRLSGGLLEYFHRRARRILPAYFAALLLVLVAGVIWCIAFHHHPANSPTADSGNPFVSDFSAGAILSHFFLVHNFKTSWALAIDSPMWSVAVESQIYILFPLILLPVWRRFGLVAMVAAGLCAGMIPVLLLPPGTNFNTSCPWFVGTFAIGTAAATCAAKRSSPSLFSQPRPWAALTIVLMAAVALVQTRAPHLWERTALWQKDLLNALAIGAFLVFLSRSQMLTHARPPLIARVLSSKPVLFLGSFSYSLYLIHRPIVELADALLPSHLQPKVHILALIATALPASLILGYLFYLPFERDRLLARWAGSLVAAIRDLLHPPSSRSGSSKFNNIMMKPPALS